MCCGDTLCSNLKPPLHQAEKPHGLFRNSLTVIGVIVLLLPPVNRRFERRSVLHPHLVDEHIPGLALARPIFVVVPAGRFLDGFYESGVVFIHPAINIIEESIVAPSLLDLHEPQGQGLRHPSNARAAPAVALACVLAVLPLRRRRMLIGPPAAASRPVLTSRRIDPRMSGKHDLGSGPAVAVGGLLIFAETNLRIGPTDASQLIIAQKKSGKDDGEFAPTAVSAPARPAGMARADHTTQIDAHLDEVHQQRLFLLLEIGAQQQCGDADHPPVLQAVLRHVLHRLFEAKKASSHPGTLRLPSARQRAESNDKNTLFVNSRWYPFVKSWYHEGRGETCTYDMRITVPRGWNVGAAELVGDKGTGQTWRFGTDTPCDRIGLLVTRLGKQQAQVGNITVTVFGRSISDSYMREIAERTCDALRFYETAFGKYPHRNLAIVEYDHMGAGGIAVPSIVLMNTERCRPEHKSDMLNMYVPHEVAHQWHSSALPIWIAEASAVYSNYLYLAQRPDGKGSLAEFHGGLNRFFEANKDYPAPLVNSSGTISYVRGGYLLMMLTSANKQRTIDSLKDFISDQLTQQLVDKDATVKSFVEAMNKAGGSDLTSFVSDWTYTVKKFDPAVTGFVQSKTGDRFNLKTSLANYEQIRFPALLRISFEDGTTYDATWNNTQENKTLEWTFDKPASSITLDPENVLLDWNRYNNFRRVSAFVAGEAARPEPAAPAKKQTTNWTTYTVADGLVGNNVSCLAIDSKGALFAGLSLYSRKPGTVVQRFDGQWTQPDSLSDASGPVFATTVQDDGTIWTGVTSNRVRRIDRSGTTIFTLSQMRDYRSFSIGKGVLEPHPQANSNIPGSIVYDLTTDEKGNILMATDNGVSIIDRAGRLVNHFGTDDGLPGSEVLCMTRDAPGTLWIGTDKGPASYRDGHWTTYPRCAAGIVLAVAISPDGIVALGTYRHGVIVYDGKNYRRYDRLNSRLPHNMVTALAYDEQNRLWAGTCLGLLRIDKDSQQVYTKENSGLLSNKITDLLADGNNIWVATDAGIAEYNN